MMHFGQHREFQCLLVVICQNFKHAAVDLQHGLTDMFPCNSLHPQAEEQVRLLKAVRHLLGGLWIWAVLQDAQLNASVLHSS